MIQGVGLEPISRNADMSKAVDKVARSGANAVVIHKGEVAAGHRGRGKDVGLIVHMSSSTRFSDDNNDKVIVCSVKEAVALGADAVSIQFQPESGKEKQSFEKLAAIVDQSNAYGIPLLAMICPCGSKNKKGKESDTEYVAQCVRLADELGVDIVSVNYTGSQKTFKNVVAACKIPVVVSDGPKMDSDKELLEMVEGAMMAGAAGLLIGPELIQRDDLTTVIGKMSKIVHKGAHVGNFYPEKEGGKRSFWEDK
jgi:class I fructose-bisphosphate aldolase